MSGQSNEAGAKASAFPQFDNIEMLDAHSGELNASIEKERASIEAAYKRIHEMKAERSDLARQREMLAYKQAEAQQ